jgi:hypothetical protein
VGIIIADFGISMVLQNIAFLIWTARAVPFPVNFGLPLEIGDLMLSRSYLWIVGVTIVLMLSLHAFLKYTRLGLAVRAVAHNKDIAYLMGINVPLMISILFGIGCAVAAAAGVLIGPINYVEVSMGIGILIKAFAAAGDRRLWQSARCRARRIAGRGRREPGGGVSRQQLQGHLCLYPADRRADGAARRPARRHRQDQSIGIGGLDIC